MRHKLLRTIVFSLSVAGLFVLAQRSLASRQVKRAIEATSSAVWGT
jgi:hypothetical protein